MKESEKKILRELIKCPHTKNGLLCDYCRYDTTKYFYDVKKMLELKGIEEEDE